MKQSLLRQIFLDADSLDNQVCSIFLYLFISVNPFFFLIPKECDDDTYVWTGKWFSSTLIKINFFFVLFDAICKLMNLLSIFLQEYNNIVMEQRR